MDSAFFWIEWLARRGRDAGRGPCVETDFGRIEVATKGPVGKQAGQNAGLQFRADPAIGPGLTDDREYQGRRDLAEQRRCGRQVSIQAGRAGPAAAPPTASPPPAPGRGKTPDGGGSTSPQARASTASNRREDVPDSPAQAVGRIERLPECSEAVPLGVGKERPAHGAAQLDADLQGLGCGSSSLEAEHEGAGRLTTDISPSVAPIPRRATDQKSATISEIQRSQKPQTVACSSPRRAAAAELGAKRRHQVEQGRGLVADLVDERRRDGTADHPLARDADDRDRVRRPPPGSRVRPAGWRAPGPRSR